LYISGKSEQIPSILSIMDNSSFFQDVYDVVSLVPSGRVTSYGAIARYLGTTGSARMVGWALNSVYERKIPAHRVVNRNGLLTGKKHFGNPDRMKELLELEGIRIRNDRVVDFERLFWDPTKELI